MRCSARGRAPRGPARGGDRRRGPGAAALADLWGRAWATWSGGDAWGLSSVARSAGGAHRFWSGRRSAFRSPATVRGRKAAIPFGVVPGARRRGSALWFGDDNVICTGTSSSARDRRVPKPRQMPCPGEARAGLERPRWASRISVAVVAARRDMVEALLSAVRKGRPATGRSSAFGMIRALRDRDAAGAEPPEGARLLCNLGDVVNLAVVRGSVCLFTGSPHSASRASPSSSPSDATHARTRPSVAGSRGPGAAARADRGRRRARRRRPRGDDRGRGAPG